MRTACAGLLLCIFSIAVSHAQDLQAERKDSIPTFSLETVVVTANRGANKLASTTSAVSVMSGEELRHLPLQKFSDAVSYMPGFFVANKDGLGRDPIVTTRGFYGGGEAEYVLVLLDGKPINDLETGLVNWNTVPVRAISSVEVSRGASSSLYGDAALGGVMNILTRNSRNQLTSVSIDGGSYGIVSGEIRQRGMVGNGHYNLSADNERTGGFREHSSWRATTLNGSYDLTLDPASSLSLSAMGQWQKSDDPGTLQQQEIDMDRTQSPSYFKADGKDENRQNVTLGYQSVLNASSQISALLYYNRKSSEGIRTFLNPAFVVSPQFQPLYPYDTTFFGDTKERRFRSNEYGINAKFTAGNEAGDFRGRLIAGLDASYGKLFSTYYSVFQGFETDYANSDLSARSAIADGNASRGKLAVYTNMEQSFVPSLAFSMGGRFDVISDSYTGRSSNAGISAHSSAVSMKVGSNYRYLNLPDYSGNVYASYNRSFKAPTLDQLTDQRSIDVAFMVPDGAGGYAPFPTTLPPFSNGSLRPQTGVSEEVGLYQKLKIADWLQTEHSLSYYTTDMTDEIDFDFQTYSYKNIQESRHIGWELGTKYYLMNSISGFINYTWSSITYKSGGNLGHFLKGIPRNVFTTGFSAGLTRELQVSLAWNVLNATPLDDENTMELGNVNYGNAKVSYLFGNVTVFADAQNVLDTKYNSTGYPAYFSGPMFYLPSAGRVLHGGISMEL